MSIKHLTSFLRTSLVYSIAISIEAIVPFVLLPILTRKLSPADYGIWTLFLAGSAFLRPLINLTLQDSIRAQYFELSPEELAAKIWTAFFIALGISVVFLALIPSVGTEIAQIFSFPADWLWAAVVMAFLYGMFQSMLAVLQFRERLALFSVLQFAHAGLALLAVGIFLYFDWSWQGAILGRLAGLGLALILLFVFAGHKLQLRPIPALRAGPIIELFVFGCRYLPSGIGVVLIPLSSRLIVARLAGLESAGLYGTAAQFAAALSLLITGYIYAWQPKLFRALHTAEQARSPFAPPPLTAKEQSDARLYPLFFSVLLPVIGAAVWASAVFALPILVGAQFRQAAPVIGWLVLAMVLQGYFEQNQVVLLSAKRIVFMSATYIAAIALNISLNLAWVPASGAIGSAQATAAAYAVAALLNGTLAVAILSKAGFFRRAEVREGAE